MKTASYKTNLFALLSTMKDSYSGLDSDFYSDSEKRLAESFLTELESYIREASFATNKTERGIIEHHMLGYDVEGTKAALGLQDGAYRVGVARLTKKFTRSLFSDGYCPDGLVSMSDIKLIRQYYYLVKALRLHFDVFDELPADVLSYMKDIKCTPTDNDFTEQDYFEALNAIAILTRSVKMARLDRVNQKALKFVFNELNKDGYNDSVYYIHLFMNTCMSPRLSTNEAYLKKVKQQYETDIGQYDVKNTAYSLKTKK